jgi:hypothetical protein
MQNQQKNTSLFFKTPFHKRLHYSTLFQKKKGLFVHLQKSLYRQKKLKNMKIMRRLQLEDNYYNRQPHVLALEMGEIYPFYQTRQTNEDLGELFEDLRALEFSSENNSYPSRGRYLINVLDNICRNPEDYTKNFKCATFWSCVYRFQGIYPYFEDLHIQKRLESLGFEELTERLILLRNAILARRTFNAEPPRNMDALSEFSVETEGKENDKTVFVPGTGWIFDRLDQF